MFTVNAYAATSATGPLAPASIKRREVGLHDVLIEISYAAICHTDIHTVRGDWGPSTYPLVPGHEITGIVKAIGPEVTRHVVGDRVGVGCMVSSCRECASCRKGEEQYCLNGYTATYGAIDRDGTLTQGGYSTHIVVDEDFVLRIPDGLELAAAAPLLCAGITVYSPLRHWSAGPGAKVAIVGLGGLGHIAVKLAHAMGAEVTVLSRSFKKQADGLRLGADHYHATSDPTAFESLAGTFDLIINTVSSAIDLNDYLALLAVDGTMVNVGAPADLLTINVFALITRRRSYAGSCFGGIRQTQEMLGFCARHGIGADTEIIPAGQVNEAYQRVLTSDVRYRFVIDTSTLS